jgi:hypothetical protein
MRMHTRRQVVILSQVLPDELTAGYSTLLDHRVRRVNGAPVRNLLHLKRAIERAVRRAAAALEAQQQRRAFDLAAWDCAEDAATAAAAAAAGSPSQPQQKNAGGTGEGLSENERDEDDSVGAGKGASTLPGDAFSLTLELSADRFVALDLRAAARVHRELLRKHRVPVDVSPDLPPLCLDPLLALQE